MKQEQVQGNAQDQTNQQTPEETDENQARVDQQQAEQPNESEQPREEAKSADDEQAASEAKPEQDDGESEKEVDGSEEETQEQTAADGKQGAEEEKDESEGGQGPVLVDVVGAEEESEPEPEAEDPVEKLRKENTKLREQLLRKAADLDNFRKRSRKELAESKKIAQADFLRELLPVFDNLERAASHAQQVEDAKAVAEGVSLVVKQFSDTLKKLGIERVPSVGSPFDPNVHEAIQQIESTEFAPGTVAAEVLGGYVWGDRLVRAAMVVVAKAPSEATEATEEQGKAQEQEPEDAQQQSEQASDGDDE